MNGDERLYRRSAARASAASCAASHLDSLATQQGIDEETREVAAHLAEDIDETLGAIAQSGRNDDRSSRSGARVRLE